MNEKKGILFKNYPDLKITEKTRADILKHPKMYISSDLRTQMAKIYTNEEFKKRSDDVLNKPLPSEDKGHKLIKKRNH